jgi:hypothetical protein
LLEIPHRLALKPVGDSLGSVVAEELLGSLRDGKQTHDPLFGFDDASLPPWKLDTEGLRETTHNIIDKAEAFRLSL